MNNPNEPGRKPDQLNMAGRPFTRYHAAELVLCGIAVILGLFC